MIRPTALSAALMLAATIAVAEAPAPEPRQVLRVGQAQLLQTTLRLQRARDLDGGPVGERMERARSRALPALDRIEAALTALRPADDPETRQAVADALAGMRRARWAIAQDDPEFLVRALRELGEATAEIAQAQE